jgi:hypothetical protein
MASETLTQTPTDTATVQFNTDGPGQSRPIETLQIEEPRNEEENIVFPTGPKLWSTMASMCIALFLSGLVSRCPHKYRWLGSSTIDRISRLLPSLYQV